MVILDQFGIVFCCWIWGGYRFPYVLGVCMNKIDKVRTTALFLCAALAVIWIVDNPPKEYIAVSSKSPDKWQPTIILDSNVGKIRLQNAQLSYANRFASDPFNAGSNSFRSNMSAVAYNFWYKKISEHPLFVNVHETCTTSDVWFGVSQSSIRIVGACSKYTGSKTFTLHLSSSEIHQAHTTLNTLTHEVHRHEQSP